MKFLYTLRLPSYIKKRAALYTIITGIRLSPCVRNRVKPAGNLYSCRVAKQNDKCMSLDLTFIR